MDAEVGAASTRRLRGAGATVAAAGNAEQQLRLLNGVYGGGDIKPGQLVKIVE